MKVITEQRHQYILNELKKDGIVQLQALISGTGASESTLRRDLQELEDEKFLQRIHGGAKRITSINEETTIPERTGINKEKKLAIAKLASEFVKDGDVIFLDSGTTTKELIEYISKFNNITVVTNSIDNASLLADFKIKTCLPGGILKNSTKALVGSLLMQTLSNYSFDVSFMGTNGFDINKGLTTPDPEEAAVKKLAIKNSKKSFLLADDTKYKQVAFCKFASLTDVTLITTNLSEDLSQNKNLEVLEAN
ncbi:DeoR/GlpR family DNA-binding transcription regulator [Companilactobacillus sp. DQM5]|uniref:DeoR/GlpR family DNA-binding transcription regulator n=1 Tax=Companilactobacillus sp. DQM5 TaxID=3463359 RepID=UPI004059F8F2